MQDVVWAIACPQASDDSQVELPMRGKGHDEVPLSRALLASPTSIIIIISVDEVWRPFPGLTRISIVEC